MPNVLLPYLPLIAFIVGVAVCVLIVNAALRWLLLHTMIGAKGYARMDPDELVPIAHFASRMQAQLAHNKLNGCGIRCLIVEEQRSMYNRLGRGFGLSPHIEVRAADASRALEILSEKE